MGIWKDFLDLEYGLENLESVPENCFGEGLWFDDSWWLFTANFLTGMGGNSIVDSSDGSLGAERKRPFD